MPLKKTPYVPQPNSRQAAVLALVLGGADVRQIGDTLDMRLLTVRQHLCILRKRGALPSTITGRPRGPKRGKANPAHASNGEPWTSEEDAIVLRGLDTLPCDRRMVTLAERLPGRTVAAVTARARLLRPRENALPQVLKAWPEWHRFDTHGRDLRLKPNGAAIEFHGLPTHGERSMP